MAGQRIDPQEETEFVWKVSLSNGTIIEHSMDFHDWMDDQPNYYHLLVGKMSCLQVCEDGDYKWNDDKCSSSYCSICEIQP